MLVKKPWSLIALVVTLGAVPQGAQAARVAVVVRAKGAGSDKAAGFVGHFVRQVLRADSRYEVIDLSHALGNPEHVRAQHAFEAAEEDVQQGTSAYEYLELDKAVERLSGALTKFERNTAYVDDVSKVAKVLMLLGATHILRDESKPAQKRLGQAMILDPGVEPDARVFNPAMRDVFQKTAASCAKLARGTLSISSSPGYAEVYLDGRFVGVTPAAIRDVVEGQHYLRLVKDGYRNWGRVVDVSARVEAADTAALKPTGRFDEFDALADAAVQALAESADGEAVAEVFNQLGGLVEANQLLLVEVRLDGERVRVTAAQFDLVADRRLKTATSTFAYDSRLETYEGEVRELLAKSFGPDTLARKDGQAGALRYADTNLCLGMPCAKLKTVALVGGVAAGVVAMGVGSIFWYMASSDNGDFWNTPQTSPKAAELKSSAISKARVGDILWGVGIALAATGTGLYLFWHPGASPQQVAKGTGPGKVQLGVVPLVQGGLLTAKLRF